MSSIYFCKASTSIYWFTTIYPIFSYIKKSPQFFFIVLLYFSIKYVFSYYITLCFYNLSDQFIRPFYQTSLLDKFIRPFYQASLSGQFTRLVHQASLSDQFIRPVYHTILPGQFIRPVYHAILSDPHICFYQNCLLMSILDTLEKDVSNVDRELDKRKLPTSSIKSS